MYTERGTRVLSRSYQRHGRGTTEEQEGLRYRYSSSSSCVAFRMGWVSRQAVDGEQAVCEPGSEAEQSEGGLPGVGVFIKGL